MAADIDSAVSRHDDAPVTTSKQAQPDRALVAETVTINRPAHELYEFWRDPTNLLAVMENISSIERIDAKRSRWTVKAPAGREVSWESVVTADVPGEEITWQSAPGADVANSGRVSFQDAGARGTVVRRDCLRPAGWHDWPVHRQAVSTRAARAGAPRSSALQAADGDRRDCHGRPYGKAA
jgi:uncharacterized membrane protein